MIEIRIPVAAGDANAPPSELADLEAAAMKIAEAVFAKLSDPAIQASIFSPENGFNPSPFAGLNIDLPAELLNMVVVPFVAEIDEPELGTSVAS